MGKREVGELAPHWFADEIARAVSTGRVGMVAREIGRTIRTDPRILAVIKEALIEPCDPRTCGASAKHRVRIAVAEAMLNYPDEG